MKAKLSFSLKVILTIAITLFAGVCFVGVSNTKKNREELPAHAVATLDGEEFSALLGGDVVLSVEKVAVDENAKYDEPIADGKYFYQRKDQSNEEKIYFENINQNNKSKQVVEDGQFVMLNNKNIGGQYINSQTSQSDAIMISIGQYVYYNKGISTTLASGEGVDTQYAQLTSLEILSFTRNGNPVTDNIRIRNIDSNEGSRFYDFMYLITETGVDIEGHYEIQFKYMIGGVSYSSDFDFFLVCESSYTKTKTVDGQTYSSAPQLGWVDAGTYKEMTASDEYIHYNEGIDGINQFNKTISYPTLTYDYTRYELSYTHIANKVSTNYKYSYSPVNQSEATMTCAISGGKTDEKTFQLLNYNEELKLVTIVFTEQGSYDLSFRYLYVGEDSANAPTMDKLTINNKKLGIHGVDLNYSKANHTQAQFRKFNFATNDNSNSKVELIVPNGYKESDDIKKYENKALELLYSTKNNTSVRVGEVVISNEKDKNGNYTAPNRTEDTLQNYNLSSKIGGTNNTLTKVLDYYATNIINTSAYADIDLSVFEFVKTNQGSMWLSHTDKIVETKDNELVSANGSFYFYSRNALTNANLIDNSTTPIKTRALPYNNQTSFNKVGYYLVFVKVDPKGDTSTTGGNTDDFWQVYAFQYMSDTIDIQVNTVTGVDVGAGKYTRENVTVSWKEPGTFETDINAYFYKSQNRNLSREEMLKLSSNTLKKDSQKLGEDIQNENFAKYLIKLERAGKSATYKMFTIDRQSITGLGAYAINARVSTNSIGYSVAVDRTGEAKQIKNAITNSLATLLWNKKASGAQITATYDYTPFVKNNGITPEFVNGQWITTNYKLGTTITNCDLEEVQFRSNVGYDSVLKGQGIYVFTIKDESGNATKYMLVIDNTEAHIQIDDGKSTEIIPNQSYRLYGDSVTYTTGTHKAVALNTTNSDLKNIITAIVDNNLHNYQDASEIKYYTKDSSASISALKNLFKNYNGTSYLTVKNIEVVAYNGYVIDTNYGSNANPPAATIVFDRDLLKSATSLYRKLYIVGENTTYSSSYTSPLNSNSYITVEINPDSSLGLAYYSNTEFDVDDVPGRGKEDSASIKRLQTGSDNNGISGVDDAYATKDNFVAFTWFLGEGKFTVAEVKYQYYALNLSILSANGKYFYEETAEDKNKDEEKDKGQIIYSVGYTADWIKDGRASYIFKTDYDGTTKPGLYKLTRTYSLDPKTNPGVDYGKDSYEKTYYFIVDRNGILDITNNIGNYISVDLLENETGVSGSTFAQISTKSEDLECDSNNDEIVDIEEKYYVYFSASKVPAMLNIPTGKYFDGTNSSRGYYAGQLSFSVYFKDIYNQIYSNKVITYKIFEQKVTQESDYFTVDFYTYLTNNEYELRDKLIANSKDGKSWLHLKGRYIVVIEDNVKTSSKITNKKIIGFNIIEEVYPEANIKIGGTNVAEDMTSVVASKTDEYGNFTVMTNQEFIRVEWPVYNKNSYLAQVDTDYLYVQQNRNNTGFTDYIFVEYGKIRIGELENGCVYLETFLRDKNSGRILTEDFNKPLVYTITIRYKLWKEEGKDIYKDCYKYYEFIDGQYVEKEYWYSTYTITIDRLAPTENVENLRKNDRLIKEGYIKSEFEPYYYEQGQMYFTYQYKDYYVNGKQLSDIYAFRVTRDTIYKKDDVKKLYVTPIVESDLKNLQLNLPIVSNFGIEKSISDVETFGNVFGESYGYYQIHELDMAGNLTQYVVYYTDNETESLIMPISYKFISDDPVEINIGDVSNDGTTIDMFNIVSVGSASTNGDWFYYVSIEDINNQSWAGLNFVTNFSTQLSGDNSITNQIINSITEVGKLRKGSYELKIIPRDDRTGYVYNLGISVYGEEDKVGLNIESLIKRENDKYFIVLDAANVKKGNNIFYAKEITVTESVQGGTPETKRYICKIENGKYNYYYDNNTKNDLTDDEKIVNATLPCKENTTYKLTLTDVFETQTHTRFNTAGKEFYKIEFDDFGKYYINGQGEYYAYSSLTIAYDNIFTIDSVEIYVDGNKQNRPQDYYTNESNVIKINKIDGKILNVVLQFAEGGNKDRLFDITIDNAIKDITLKDFTTGEEKNTTIFNNIKLDNIDNLKECAPESITSGIMNLSWFKEEKENYKYNYSLYEYKKDGNIYQINISDVYNKVIDTQEDSLGIYWLVIDVYSPEFKLLGNKIYAFEVQSVNSQLYYVKDESGLAIAPNSSFTYSEIEDYSFNTSLPILPATSMPLYITNQELTIVLTENISSYSFISDIGNGQTLTVYEIDATTYSLYFGILKVNKTDKLIQSNININGTKIGGNEFVTFANKNPIPYVLNAEQTPLAGVTGEIINKNLILLDIYYNGIFVKTEKYSTVVNHEILGNGSYTFKFRDLAGNQHIYENETDSVEALILREVVVTINDEVPVENAYYNEEVSLKVYAATKYETGSIMVTAYRNGKEYQVSSSNPYIFKDYGTYVVTIKGTFKDNSGTSVDLTKTVTFSILNVKEVRTAIDLTNLSQHKIVKVTNPSGIDVTNAFMKMINNKENAMLITYEDVMDNMYDLQVSAGKLMFTVEYLISDGIYPNRNLQVQFTLNNEKPVINSSLEIGESSTEGFSISFNPGILYEQIGEGYIYINDKIAYTIDENSTFEVVSIGRTFKGDGAGDYYVKLVGTSGNVWESFKVEIKEPLNFGAIIIIIVVVAVVATVIITIIVLRRKMRIR